MEYFDNILCVTYKELLDIMPKGTLNSQLSREKLDVVSRGGGENNPALYAYSSLPEKYKKRWVERHGEPEKQMRQEMIRNIVKKDEKAENFFEDYRYDKNGEMVALPEDVKKEYTWNASVLNALMEEFKRLSSSNNKLTGFRRNLWELLLVTSEEWRPVYGHSLPGSVGRLKALINKFRPDNYGVLVSGKYGNSNTLKIEEDGGRYLVALKRSRVPVYTDMEIFEEYNRVAPERGWKPLKSPRSLREWFNSPRVEPLWYDAVYGEMKAHQRYDRKHRTILPGRRDSLWYGDGTKLNLYYRDENGNKCTTSVYEVVDAYSEVLLGYYISDNEDYIAQYHAFRMAIQMSRHKPYEIVCDNQGGHKKNAALGLFSKISRIHRPTAPYNGESKTIENIFYRFQSQVLKKCFGFTGQNITAKRDTSRPNLEFINANIDSLPTLEELKEQYAAAREQWNSMKHPATGISRIEMYNTSVNEATDAVSVSDMVEMFWYTTEKPSLFTANGIEITVQGKKYPYEVFSAPGEPDLEWRRRNTYKKFYVQYDPYDMSSVRLLYKDKGGAMRFECVASFPLMIHRADVDDFALRLVGVGVHQLALGFRAAHILHQVAFHHTAVSCLAVGVLLVNIGGVGVVRVLAVFRLGRGGQGLHRHRFQLVLHALAEALAVNRHHAHLVRLVVAAILHHRRNDENRAVRVVAELEVNAVVGYRRVLAVVGVAHRVGVRLALENRHVCFRRREVHRRAC